MRASHVVTSLRVLTWCCIILLAVLSLLPGQVLAALPLLSAFKMVRTVLSGPLEHFVAYAGVAAIAMAGYGPSLGGMRIIGGLCVYAGRQLGIRPALFAGPASIDREVCRLGSGSALRRARHCPPLASRFRSPSPADAADQRASPARDRPARPGCATSSAPPLRRQEDQDRQPDAALGARVPPGGRNRISRWVP